MSEDIPPQKTDDIMKIILEQKQKADIELGNVEEANRTEQMLFLLDKKLGEGLSNYDRDLVGRID